MELQQPALATVPGDQTESQPRRLRVAVWLVWSLWTLYLLFAGLSLLFEVVTSPSTFVLTAIGLVVLLTYATVGVLIVLRQPGNPIGWIFVIAPLLITLNTFAVSYAIYALVTRPGSLPGADIMTWVAIWTRDPGFLIIFTFLLLLFPNGKLPSPRWRFVAWSAAITIVLFALFMALQPGPLPFAPAYDNPFGIEEIPIEILIDVGITLFFLIMATIIACALSAIVRFRQARGDERQQLKWFAYAAVLMSVFLVVSQVAEFLETPIQQVIYDILLRLAVATVPIATAFAIFKYRLYDIDIVINRTLVYVPLTAVLAGLYAVLDLLLQAVFYGVTGDRSDAAIVLTTLIIASVFTPVKSGIQDRVDKVFKEAPDADKKLKALRDEIESRIYAIDPGQLTNRLLEEAVYAFNAKSGALYLKRDGNLHLARSRGDWHDGKAIISIPLEHAGEQVGLLKLGERAARSGYTERDTEALQKTADSVAAAIASESPTSLIASGSSSDA